MPYQIKFDSPPIGYSADSAKEGEEVTIIYQQFLSSEDGMFFIKILEDLLTSIILALPKEANITSSTVDHLLAHMDKNGDMTVYVNELRLKASIRVKRALKEGSEIYETDIADINTLSFEGVEVPDDHAVIVLFSKGWRKGLYFDFSPMHGTKRKKDTLWATLGSSYNYLSYQELYSLNDEQWKFLFKEQWFPFIGLTQQTTQSLINIVESKWNPDDLLEKIESELIESFAEMIDHWGASKIFKNDIEFIEKAVERFVDKDYVSATAIIYPRIEGLLRKLSQETGLTNYKQEHLASVPLKASKISDSTFSRLLPERFNEYLNKVYFANFDPNSPKGLSRNTVGHGVAKIDSYSLKGAILGFLIIEQIYYHIPSNPDQKKDEKKG